MKKILLALPLLALFISCSPRLPPCDATNATNLVQELADEELAKQIGAEYASNFVFSVNMIRTTHKNSQTGALQCAAVLLAKDLTDSDNKKGIPITYTIELLDDGKTPYVSVGGLATLPYYMGLY
ncbi:hypothetical protein P0082_01350 [Candidatus Haliotispira prima]|uniref:Lipoprotein n=1 Tax=Candidatus Haliotispira prima TaxID=3034016 RepID=A0ABY8ML51_9SPIO|nr:hypothetical protein P0082_01350 [Candidatus Haliotispira prima]